MGIPEKIVNVGHIKRMYDYILSLIQSTKTELQSSISEISSSMPDVTDEISSVTATMNEFRQYLGVEDED